MVRFWFSTFIILAFFFCNQLTEESQYQQSLLQQWDKELLRLEDEVSKLDDDLSKTVFLRDYCSQIADYGPMSKTSNSYFSQQNWGSQSMANVYDVFTKDSLPVSCGTISEFYCQLLNHFNFQCATYGHGIDLQLSHVFVLVEIDDDNKKKIIIQDPHYALMYVDKNDRPLDFSTLIQHIQLEEYRNILLNKNTIETKLIIEKEMIPSIQKILNDRCLQAFRKMKEDSEYIIVKAERAHDILIDNACNSVKNAIEEKLISKKYPTNINHLLLLKRHVGGKDKLYFEKK